MSLVTVIARWNYITVMCDGQATNKESHRAIVEDVKKFKMLGSEQFIAFTGDKLLAEEGAEMANELYNMGYNLHEIASTLQQKMIEQIPYNEQYRNDVQFAIGGKTNQNSIAYYVISNKYNSVDQMQSYTPDKTSLFYNILGGDYCTFNKKEALEKLIGKNNCVLPEQVLLSQKELNSMVAQEDHQVNNHTSFLKITL